MNDYAVPPSGSMRSNVEETSRLKGKCTDWKVMTAIAGDGDGHGGGDDDGGGDGDDGSGKRCFSLCALVIIIYA